MYITGPILKAKAVQLHQQLHEARGGGEDGSVKEFVASDGWLWKFSRRHAIRQLTLQGEKLSADKPAANDFISSFQNFIEENNYTLNQIFNCDETGLYYRLLPQKTLASSLEKSADGRKRQKERVTINACSNVLGTIKLSLLLIGKYKNPRCFKNIARDSLPVIYENQSNAWVNTSIFANWFHQHFVPIVRREFKKLGIQPKAVLILDNCSAHPDEEELVSSDGKIIAKYLPPNVTSLIQPMDQGVLELIKRRYRRKILEELVLRDDEGISIPDYLKSINMLTVTTLISACWDEISAKTLRLSWRKILPEPKENSKELKPNGGSTQPDTGIAGSTEAEISQESGGGSTQLDKQNTLPDEGNVQPITGATEPGISQESLDEFTSVFQRLGHNLTDAEIREWLASDENDPGYAHLTDDEIVSSIVQDSTQQDSEEDSDSSDEATQVTVSHSAAVKMFDGCLQWLQEQNEACMYNIGLLQELRAEEPY